MKKFLTLLFVLVISLSFFGCGKVEYVYTENIDNSFTEQYNIYLDDEYLAEYGYNSLQMKTFLFKYIYFLSGNTWTEDEEFRNEVTLYNDDQTIIFDCFYNTEKNIVSFALTYQDIDTYNSFYRIDDPPQPNVSVEKGFFFYKYYQKIYSPLLIIRQEWHNLYENELYSKPHYAQGIYELPSIFMLGQKNAKGEFKGFREAFPDIPKEDITKLLYRFAILYVRGRVNTAPDVKLIGGLSYLVWDQDYHSVVQEITLITLKPNPVGWYVLALILTAVFAGILVLIAFVNKKSNNLDVAIPPPPNAPPSIFGDDYK